MFRGKVHGIMGISRQIGQDEMGEQAEIMEMAAKTENHVFIRWNLPKVLTQLQGVHDDVEREFKELRARYEDKGKETEKVVANTGKVVEIPVSMKDRIKTAELLGRSYGMFTDKKEINGNVSIDIGMGDYDEDD